MFYCYVIGFCFFLLTSFGILNEMIFESFSFTGLMGIVVMLLPLTVFFKNALKCLKRPHSHNILGRYLGFFIASFCLIGCITELALLPTFEATQTFTYVETLEWLLILQILGLSLFLYNNRGELKDKYELVLSPKYPNIKPVDFSDLKVRIKETIQSSSIQNDLKTKKILKKSLEHLINLESKGIEISKTLLRQFEELFISYMEIDSFKFQLKNSKRTLTRLKDSFAEIEKYLSSLY